MLLSQLIFYFIFPLKPASFGGGRGSDLNNLVKKKEFNANFHCRLEQKFPDWHGRMAYQKKQEKLYESAMKKQGEGKKNWMQSIIFKEPVLILSTKI